MGCLIELKFVKSLDSDDYRKFMKRFFRFFALADMISHSEDDGRISEEWYSKFSENDTSEWIVERISNDKRLISVKIIS